LKSLGDGSQAKVYLARSIEEPSHKVAIKIFRESYLDEAPEHVKYVETEIQILKSLPHKNIVGFIGYGSDGSVVKNSGK